MLQVARLSPKLLGDAVDLVARFLLEQLGEEGGFQDRAGRSDLYYTVFGIESLLALRSQVPFDAIAGYLRSHEDGNSLDFVHLACLARSWGNMPRELKEGVPAKGILGRLEAYRTSDGGYHPSPGRLRGSAYGCLLALGSYQDLAQEMPQSRRMLACLEALESEDGAYANQEDSSLGQTPATAAAVALLRHLGAAPRPELGKWLLERCHPGGGFFATPQAPIPDLLSTATALHALAGLKVPLDAIREPCLDFIDSLWTNRGAFHGNWSDAALDCEYTYYGLLALGHLSL